MRNSCQVVKGNRIWLLRVWLLQQLFLGRKYFSFLMHSGKANKINKEAAAAGVVAGAVNFFCLNCDFCDLNDEHERYSGASLAGGFSA
ncbi:hypothetical protein [Botryobacter ruber]|uniref:hypothetical protein n=1 Tax=Botryobacter ruber TaxID=2171629 RepID=UPI000F647336|nr:hypothetical protein [Botryobacter ruber]